MLIFSFSFKKCSVSTVVMTTEQRSDEAKTGCANSVRVPTWDIQRRRDRLFTDLYGSICYCIEFSRTDRETCQ